MPSLSPLDVLVRLATNPQAVFSLRDIDPGDMALLRPLVTFRPEPEKGDSIDCPTRAGSACLRVLGTVGGELMAICPCEAREAPLRVATLELTTFRIDVDRLAQALAIAFEVTGPAAAVSDRCWYLGQGTAEGRRVALVLGLFDERDAMNELRAVPGVLPEAVDEIVCLTPGYDAPPTDARALAAIRVRTSRLDRFDPQGSLSDLLRTPTRTVPLITLTEEQEHEFADAGFKCRWPIVIHGATGKGGTNIIEIDGQERPLGRAMFPLFMRLVTGLFETENGYLPVGRLRGGGGLAREGYYSSDGAYQAIDRLRSALGAGCQELVEVAGGAIRLSTHPGYVRVECDVLAQHRDARVQQLAARIAAGPTYRQGRFSGEERAPDAHEP